jgi:undecaprenyl diphosphate synthase
MEHPACIGIIMDGNRRWAAAHGVPSSAGHQAGYEKLKEVAAWGREEGIGTAVFYAFSTENWKREQAEVGYLMDLLRLALAENFDSLRKENVRMRFIGQKERFDHDIVQGMERVEEETSRNTGGTVALALSYGGRAEILSAVNRLLSGRVPSVDEETFSARLWTAGIPDPDLIIRTGGERRLSNFLPWQGVYSELAFTDTYWPDFSQDEFRSILADFASRTRRRGA